MGNARQHNRERKARKFARGLSCAADLGLSRECLSFVDALPGEQKLRLLTHLEDRHGELHDPGAWLIQAAKNALAALGRVSVPLDMDPVRREESASREEWLSLGRAQPRRVSPASTSPDVGRHGSPGDLPDSRGDTLARMGMYESAAFGVTLKVVRLQSVWRGVRVRQSLRRRTVHWPIAQRLLDSWADASLPCGGEAVRLMSSCVHHAVWDQETTASRVLVRRAGGSSTVGLRVLSQAVYAVEVTDSEALQLEWVLQPLLSAEPIGLRGPPQLLEEHDGRLFRRSTARAHRSRESAEGFALARWPPRQEVQNSGLPARRGGLQARCHGARRAAVRGGPGVVLHLHPAARRAAPHCGRHRGWARRAGPGPHVRHARSCTRAPICRSRYTTVGGSSTVQFPR